MVRTGIAIIILLIATVLFPLWVQLVLYCVACVVIRHRSALLLPALFADLLYTPIPDTLLRGHRYVLFVLVLLALSWIVLRFTRLGQRDNDTNF